MSTRLYSFAAAVSCALFLAACPGRDAAHIMVSGEIRAVAVQAGSRVGGRVAEVPVKEGQRVAKDEVILKLEDNEAQAKLAAAQAQLAQAQAMFTKAENGATDAQQRQAEAAAKAAHEQYTMARKGARAQEISAASAAAEGAKSQRDAAKLDFDRMQTLSADEAVSKRQLDVAKAAYDAADAQWRALRDKETMLVEGLRSEEVAAAKANYDRAQAAYDDLKAGVRAEDREAAKAARDAAAAQVQLAQANLDEMTVKSPMAAVVDSLDVHPGDLVRPGTIVRLVNPDDLELTVYVSAGLLGGLHVGDKLAFQTDSHGEQRFEAPIKHIASEGEFTPRNMQTQEERVQQVFGVKLALDSAGGKLRPGMTATVLVPKSGSR